tara:strand:+ start:257 stop:418 length:162 start_codon:yes stop_codon:yes gene_type:complete
MIWFFFEYPIISGLIVSIVMGVPLGMDVVWTLRGIEMLPEKDQDVWDDEWDLR